MTAEWLKKLKDLYMKDYFMVLGEENLTYSLLRFILQIV